MPEPRRMLRCQDRYLHLVAAHPDAITHNIETVPRIYRSVRTGAEYADELFAVMDDVPTMLRQLLSVLRVPHRVWCGTGEC